ncbi:MAG: TetR/AcrR family transcriptional regulator [Anaerolineales bacterium]|nr:TetR/AcrR family transcriptional regulator [Anaerolineales bacterium]
MSDKPRTSTSELTRDRIIEAASQLFAERGFSGTTTRAISERAGINEVTLFRHFGSKEKLARAIMEKHGGEAIAGDIELRFSGNYEQDLTLMGRMMMKVMIEKVDAIRMAICESGKFPEFQQVVAENPRQLRKMLARYFQSQMDARVIHPGHPETLAQAFLGMFFSYTVLSGLLKDSLEPEISQTEIVNQFVAVFLRGTCIED